MKKFTLGVATLLLSANAVAGIITLDFDDAACATATGSAAICNKLKTDLNAEIEDKTPNVDGIDKYGKATANATATTSKGYNTDYADNFAVAVINASAGVGQSGGGLSDMESAEGIAVQGGLTLGVNLKVLPVNKVGFIDLEKLQVFGTFMGFDKKTDADDTSSEAKISQFGLMARYHLVEGTDVLPGYMLEWGGVHIHTGFYSSKMKLDVVTALDDVSSTKDGVTAKMSNGTANFIIDSNITSIPVEISTYLRMAYVFTLYGGLGVDFNTGKAKVGATSSGDVNIAASKIADVDVDLTGSGNVNTIGTRAFLGLQFNIPFVRVYAQVQNEFASKSAAAQLGVKLLY